MLKTFLTDELHDLASLTATKMQMKHWALLWYVVPHSVHDKSQNAILASKFYKDYVRSYFFPQENNSTLL